MKATKRDSNPRPLDYKLSNLTPRPRMLYYIPYEIKMYLFKVQVKPGCT